VPSLGLKLSLPARGLGLVNNVPSWVLRSSGIAAAADLDFQNGQYYGGQLASLLTCSRASTGYAKNSGGLLISFANDALRITDLGLLMEESRTNALAWSNNPPNWSIPQVGCSAAQNVVGPTGTANEAWTITQTGANASDSRYQNNAAVTSSSNTYRISCFVKKQASVAAYPALKALFTGGTQVDTGIVIDVVNGAATALNGSATNISVEDYGSFWRASFSVADNATGNTLLAYSFYPAWNASYSITKNTVSGAANVFAFGQRELGAFTTSYIPTTSSSASRSADVINVAGSLASLLANSSSGSAYGSAAGLPTTRTGNAAILSSSPALPLFINATGTGKAATFNGTNSITLANANTWSAGAKAVLGWDGSGRSIVSTGNSLLSDANTIGLGASVSLASGGNALNGYLRRLAVWSSRLSDTNLTALAA